MQPLRAPKPSFMPPVRRGENAAVKVHESGLEHTAFRALQTETMAHVRESG